VSRVERLEDQVKGLTAEELKSFREWFTQFDADSWDAQIEADAKSGKLQAFAERAARDHKSGRSTRL